MKKIGPQYWNYKGCDVYETSQPTLYEVYRGCDLLTRTNTLKQAKEFIDSYTAQEK